MKYHVEYTVYQDTARRRDTGTYGLVVVGIGSFYLTGVEELTSETIEWARTHALEKFEGAAEQAWLRTPGEVWVQLVSITRLDN